MTTVSGKLTMRIECEYLDDKGEPRYIIDFRSVTLGWDHNDPGRQGMLDQIYQDLQEFIGWAPRHAYPELPCKLQPGDVCHVRARYTMSWWRSGWEYEEWDSGAELFGCKLLGKVHRLGRNRTQRKREQRWEKLREQRA